MRRTIAVASLTLGSSFTALGQGACTDEKLDAFRDAARALDERAPSLAEPLRSCAAMRSEVAHWLAFFHRARGDYSKSREAATASGTLASGHRTMRDELLAGATQGSHARLRAAVEADEAGLGRDLEALLVLARALARAEDHEGSLVYYDRYLAARPTDWDIKLERCYVFVWSGDYDTAARELERLAALSDTPPALRKSAHESLAQVRAQQMRSKPKAPPRQLGARATHYETAPSMVRQSLEGEYVGGFWAFATANHRIAAAPFRETYRYLAQEARARASYDPHRLVNLAAGIGAFSTEKSELTYEGAVTVALPASSKLSLGVYRTPMALFVPLEVRDSMILDVAQHATLSGPFRSTYKYTRHTVEDYSPFTKQSLLVEPTIQAVADGGELTGRVRLDRDDYAAANALYFSPKYAQLYTFGLGIRQLRAGPASIEATADTGVIQVQDHGASAKEVAVQYTELSLDVGVELGDSLAIKARYFAGRTVSQKLKETTYEVRSASLALHWSLDQVREETP